MSDEDDEVGDRIAPEGAWFVCGACGRVSQTKYGLTRGYAKHTGWDESCMLNSQPYWAKDLTPEPRVDPDMGGLHRIKSGRVRAVAPGAAFVPRDQLLKMKEDDDDTQ
jgi:hypothetical protein